MKSVIAVLISLLVLVTFTFGTDFTVHGVYTAWGQSQHNFWFGNKSKPKYNDNYVVQMLRFKVTGAVNDNLKFVTRLDIAQGWWGVDNARRSVDRPYGKYGASSLFDFKDTNFLVHVDQAYIEFGLPNTPVNVRVGRMWYGLGNKIMVDNNYDGVQIDFNKVIGNKLTFSWAKVSEGVDALSDEKHVKPDGQGNTDARDANLFTLNFNGKAGSLTYNLYGLYYNDASIADNNAYVPDHLQFFKTRFSPQITTLSAVGFAGVYKNEALTIKGELDYLTGKDKINNTTHGPKQKWDINNGNLSGYNFYLNATYAASDKLTIGAIAGMGSGDKNLNGGKGNVNKLRTSGFFYITEVWEDSIMPDEEGITPQGLGAPNVRGYRELENTTIAQINATLKPLHKMMLFGSYSYIRATQPIPKWDKNGNPDYSATASDLGQEVDFKIGYKVYPELILMLRGGVFMPGDAAGYLINGTNDYKDKAWELKATVTYKF